MTLVSRFARRLLPALLMASSVMLLSVGVFNWAPPQTLGDIAFVTPSPDAGDPAFPPSQPAPTSPTPSATASLGPSAEPTPTPASDSPPTRVVVPSLGIDLPVVPGNSDYPLCDVAQYLLGGFVNPGVPGTTYLYGHARKGMFLPLLDASTADDNGASMIGALVKVYTADLQVHIYQIDIVKRHAVDLSLAFELEPNQHRLILQTSEGPHGTVPKLQVAARPIGVYRATADEALPSPHPDVCGF